LVVKYFSYLKHTALDRLQVRLNVSCSYITMLRRAIVSL